MTPINLKTPLLKRIVYMGTILCFLGLVLFYVSFQARFLIAGPQISLIDEPGSIQEARGIKIAGVANNITAIYLNGRPIVTTEDGHFEELVVLENGYTNLHLRAEDRFGREVDLERNFVYTGPGSVIN